VSAISRGGVSGRGAAVAAWRGTRLTWRIARRDLRAPVARCVLGCVAVTLGVA
jgi:hypothetical protein